MRSEPEGCVSHGLVWLRGKGGLAGNPKVASPIPGSSSLSAEVSPSREPYAGCCLASLTKAF